MKSKSPQQRFLQNNKDIFLKYVEDKATVTASVVYDDLVKNDPKKLTEIINQNSAFSFEAWAGQYFKN